jgi:hypothetical protein
MCLLSHSWSLVQVPGQGYLLHGRVLKSAGMQEQDKSAGREVIERYFKHQREWQEAVAAYHAHTTTSGPQHTPGTGIFPSRKLSQLGLDKEVPEELSLVRRSPLLKCSRRLATKVLGRTFMMLPFVPFE